VILKINSRQWSTRHWTTESQLPYFLRIYTGRGLQIHEDAARRLCTVIQPGENRKTVLPDRRSRLRDSIAAFIPLRISVTQFHNSWYRFYGSPTGSKWLASGTFKVVLLISFHTQHIMKLHNPLPPYFPCIMVQYFNCRFKKRRRFLIIEMIVSWRTYINSLFLIRPDNLKIFQQIWSDIFCLSRPAQVLLRYNGGYSFDLKFKETAPKDSLFKNYL
jgi:hypothetical protein